MSPSVLASPKQAFKVTIALSMAWILTMGGALSKPESHAAPAESAAQAQLPNVLFIVTDDQRAKGTMTMMPKTLGWFKKKGTRYPEAFATTPLCCPARGSIFTGRFAHNHGLFRSNPDPSVFEQDSTMQAYLKGRGYQTAIVGKYLNAWDVAVDPPYFDRWSNFSRGFYNGSKGYTDLTFNIEGNVRSISRYSTHFIRDQSVGYLDWFEKRDSQPWFLYVSPFAPHAPAQPAHAYRNERVPEWSLNPAVLEEDRTDKPPFIQATRVPLDRLAKERRLQLRTLMSVDDMVDKILRKTKNNGELRDTLAVFMTDNGVLWGEHGRRTKSLPYTHSLRIPLFIRRPGQSQPAVDKRVVTNLDLAPSVLDAVGVSPDPAYPVDGRSLFDPSWTRDRLLSEFWRLDNYDVPTWASLRTPTYQYVEYYNKQESAITFREYYDLTADPWQLENLLHEGEPPGVDLEALSRQLAQDRACSGETCP